jgi:hypothetical protein
MKKMLLVLILIATLTCSIGISNLAIAQMQSDTETYDCETCPMTVGADAQDHLKVFDGNGTRHWVECIGCALKLLKTCDTLHIETYCDWYGPNYTVTIDISEHGKVTTVTPDTALLLIGGGCTGNRVAYNQTAADSLLANGYSQYTMTMMQQTLPANTNTTSFPAKALTFTIADTAQPSSQPLMLALIAVVGIAVIAGSLIAFKKLKK